ncbi:acyl-CoA/acyl-ACP dehydrogenase [Myxococcota bacterium]|nr:acyl-CoA/acyl-ACP dehydrogenase [Myxococcota bacterium]
MDFGFSEDQTLLQQTVRDFLEKECTPDSIRTLWESETGRSPELWAKLSEIGLPALLVPEAYGGLGLDERDAVLALEETGRFALAEPIVTTAVVAAPLLSRLTKTEHAGFAASWLERIAGGEALAAVAAAGQPLISDAHVANLLLLSKGDRLYAAEPHHVQLTAQPANDQSQRLFSVDWDTQDALCLASGDEGLSLQAEILDRGAFGCAAQLVGIADRLIEMGALYASQRKQFGVPVGSFQAVKHRLANAKVDLEYGRSIVHRSAHSVFANSPSRSIDVSMAKAFIGEAARFAAGESLQVHGAIGYTYEQDLHIWMKRAWSLDLAFASGAWHRARVGDALIDGGLSAPHFGYEPRDL